MSDLTSHLRARQLGRELAGSSGDSASQSREEARVFLQQLIMRCLQKSAAERIRDARAFREALRTCQDAGSWSEAEARDWFVLHALALRARTPRSSVSGSTTIAVDLGLRESPARATPRHDVP